MAEQYYATQPLELTKNRKLLEATFDAINAETNLCFSTDYPHWDFDLPSTIYDLPFLSEEAKRNILGGNAAEALRPQALAARQGRQADLRRLNNGFGRPGPHALPSASDSAASDERRPDELCSLSGERWNSPQAGLKPLTVEEFDTTRHLAHAARQASERGFDKMTLVDADTHHDETGSFRQMVDYIDSTVERQKARANTNEGRRPMIPLNISYADHRRPGAAVRRAQARKDAGQCAPRHHAHAPFDDGDGCDLRRALSDRCHAACDPAQARLGILR